MKKSIFYNFIVVVIATLALFLYRLTGAAIHACIALVAVLSMALSARKAKKDWKKPKLELAYRVIFLFVIVTGVLISRLVTIVIIALIHKILALAFIIVFVSTFIITTKTR